MPSCRFPAVSWAQPLHILASFWGLVLMALHLGLHWGPS
ncbi:MAG: DUF4405 domain-containing protein [Evtepia sp.]